MGTELMESARDTELAVVPATPTDILRLAVEKGADADALEKIARLIRDQQTFDAERAFNAAMCACQAELEPVARNAYNKQTESYYAKLETIGRAIDPIVHKHGFSQSFGVVDCAKPDWIRVVCDVMHRDGHCRQYQLDLPPDDKGIKGSPNKTLVHGTISTNTYAQRILTCSIFKVRLAGFDTDGNTPQGDPIDEAQQMAIQESLDSREVNRDAFWKWLDIPPGVKNIPASRYDEVMGFLARKPLK